MLLHQVRGLPVTTIQTKKNLTATAVGCEERRLRIGYLLVKLKLAKSIFHQQNQELTLFRCNIHITVDMQSHISKALVTKDRLDGLSLVFLNVICYVLCPNFCQSATMRKLQSTTKYKRENKNVQVVLCAPHIAHMGPCRTYKVLADI